MRRMMILALTAALVVPVAAQQRRDEMTAEERARLEARLDQLRNELRELERRLGRVIENRLYLRSEDGEPFVWRVGTNRARLGVIVATAPGETDTQGARLEAVTPNGPAAQAGLRAGDVITRVNGVSLANTRPSPGQRLIDEVDDLDDGDTVRVEYRRGTETGRATIVARANAAFGYSYSLGGEGPRVSIRMDSLRVRLDSLRPSVYEMGEAAGVLNRALVEVREMPGIHASVFTNRWSSMELTTLDADLGAYFGTTEGVLVVRAPRDSLLGLKSGDVIQRIGGRVPSSPSHAVRILRSYEPGDQIRIEIMRNRRSQTLNATVPAASEDRGLFWEWEGP